MYHSRKLALVCGALSLAACSVGYGEEAPDAGLAPDLGPDAGMVPCDLLPPSGVVTEDRELTIPRAGFGVAPADGYDSLTGAVLGTCIEGNVVEDGGSRAEWNIELLDTRRDVADYYSTGVSLSVGFGGFGFSTSFNTSSSSALRETNVNLLISVDVTRSASRIDSGAVLVESAQALRRESPLAFRNRCGDRYVQSVQYGGHFDVLLSISTRDEAEQRELSVSVGAMFGPFGSVNAGHAEGLSTLIGSREVDVFVNRVGGSGELPDLTDLEGLISYAEQFASEVENTEQLTPISFTTRPYDRIAGTACDGGLSRAADMLLLDAWDALQVRYEFRARAEEIIEDTSRFPCYDARTPITRSAAAENEAHIEAIRTLARDCSRAVVENPEADVEAPSCQGLRAEIDATSVPELPLRYDSLQEWRPRATVAQDALSLSADSWCSVLETTGLYWIAPVSSDVTGNPCPTPTITADRASISWGDTGLSDNTSTCEYLIGCVEHENFELYECLPPPRSCAELLAETPSLQSGRYIIDPDGTGDAEPRFVECDMETDGGGWTLVGEEDWEDATEAEVDYALDPFPSRGWEGEGYARIYQCGTTKILRRGGAGQPRWNLDLEGLPHAEARVKLRYFSLDSWDDETGVVRVDGSEVWQQTWNASEGIHLCGSGNYVDRRADIDATLDHTQDTLQLMGTANLNDGASDESFGMDDLEVWVR